MPTAQVCTRGRFPAFFLATPRGENKTFDFLLCGIRLLSLFMFYIVPNSMGREVRPMHNKQQFRNSLSRTVSCGATAVTAITIVFALTAFLTQAAQAQTYKVIYNFTGGADGAMPLAGLTMDAAGNLYGTSASGGAGYGTVFRLHYTSPDWTLSSLYTFQGGDDGSIPEARVIMRPDGALYGTTAGGGAGCPQAGGCGTVFELRVPANATFTRLGSWMETVLYRFANGSDGGYPDSGDLTFDQAGNIYGTTALGGNIGINGNCNSGCGTVYKLTPPGGSWTETVLYAFTNDNHDGTFPNAGVILDNSGNLYGTTIYGGADDEGTVFKLTSSNGGWAESILYNFTGGSDGSNPYTGLIFDQAGSLYGATIARGSGNGGTVFELTSLNGSWTFTLLTSLSGETGDGPDGSLIMDAAGNLYGTTYGDGAYGAGSVFRLSPSNGSWTYTSLHDFTAGSDGGYPQCSLILDANGNLYGTTGAGGTSSNCQGGCGVVFEITP
ncbi:MAG: choice-of-anchor tandem repeat GloVer-containing protein [Candidatus Korobacteraceae bacterium]